MDYGKFEGLLAEKGTTAYAVAKATGIPPSTFSDWKKGKSKPKIEKIMKVCNVLGVPMEYFLTDPEPETKEETA